MRDILLSVVLFGSLPVILVNPPFGIVMWDWVAMMVGGATLIAWFFSKETKRVPLNAITVLMFLLITWTGITTIFAINEVDSIDSLIKFSKIILMVFVTISIMNDAKRVNWLVWAIVCSIGYFGIKGGLFTIVSGGHFRVWGPTGSFIADNNALALAILMVIPLMIYLAKSTQHKWIRIGMYVAVLLSMLSVIGSWSRGGLLGLIVLAILLWWRARHRMIIGIMAGFVLVFSVSFIPPQWFERMNTIENYEKDASATGRLDIWGFALRVANARPIVGGGFEVFVDPVAHDKWGEGIVVRNVHSIYFQMLGSHGYPGLIIFLALGYFTLRACRRIRKAAATRPEFEHHGLLASYVSCGLLSFAVSGAFQNLATFDLYYTMIAIAAILQKLVLDSKVGALSPATVGHSVNTLAQNEADNFAGAGKVRTFVRQHQ
jgi:probable O-glycosylation ligase (exosortase A-associated)